MRLCRNHVPTKRSLQSSAFNRRTGKKFLFIYLLCELCARLGGLFLCCLTVIRLFNECQSSQTFMSFKIFLPYFHGNFCFPTEMLSLPNRQKQKIKKRKNWVNIYLDSWFLIMRVPWKGSVV